MIVVSQQTEDKLFQDLKTCWQTLPTYRCLHLKLSQIDEDTKDWHTLLTHTLRTMIDERNGQIYVCHDGDVFVITRTLTQKRTDDILAHLAQKLSPALATAGLAAIYEVGVDWPRLRALCEKKIENLKFSQIENKTQNKTPQISKEQALKAMDPELIKTLAARRQKRQSSEIMVVEDDPFSQKLVSNVLENNYSLSMSDNGAGALMSYVIKAPDVLFLDIGLPDMDGHQVLQRLFQIDPNAFVVMLSGNGDKDNVIKAIQSGAKGFVGKPFTRDKLIQYIEKSPFIQAKRNKEKLHANTHN
ncbi:MAG: response regulator [Bdellovibrionales bacterium]